MTDQRYDKAGLSRRVVLHGGAAVAGAGTFLGASLAASPAAADAKMDHKLVRYQPTPNGAARCQSCSQYVPKPACKLVNDPITPTGWCLLYAAKAS